MNVPYDSRNSFYRSPMGAVEEGTQIHFKILVPRSLNCVNADLSIKHDFDGDWTRCNMFWCGTCGDGFETWECHYTPEKIGLYWHGFRLHTNEGMRFIVPAGPEKKSEICRSPGAAWQITCYQKGFETPKWPLGGVMYLNFSRPVPFFRQPQGKYPAGQDAP